MRTDGGLLGVAAVSGLVLGSYAVTAGLRLSRAEASHRGRSHCDDCGTPLGFAQTIPVVSYLRLGGACSACGVSIDPIHLVGEVAGAVIVVAALVAAPSARGALISIIGLCLIAAAATDAKSRRLPDMLTGMVAIAGLGLSMLRGWSAAAAGLISASVALVLLLTLRRLWSRWRGDPGLGLGDVKLIAALALWLGAETSFALLVAALLGLLVTPFLRGRHGRIAFGPMIAAGGWSVGLALELGWRPWVL